MEGHNEDQLSFDNTEVAFKNKTDADLIRAYWLFRVIGNRVLNIIGPPLTSLAFRLRVPIEPLIKATIFKHFCGGESIEECEGVIRQLALSHVGTILDYSVEGEQREEVFDETAQEIIRTIKRSEGDSRIPFTVFKITGVARFALLEKESLKERLSDEEKHEYRRAEARVFKICEAAFHSRVPLMIDAEESWIQDAIDALALKMMQQFNCNSPIIYNTYQLYRKDKLISLLSDAGMARTQRFILGAKLVRGAYMDKERDRSLQMNYPSKVHDTKADTDKAYNEALKRCIEQLDVVAIVAGTHNEESCMQLVQLMKAAGLPRDHSRVYFSQLLGMSDNLSFNLADAGYNVAKYVPYGPVQAVMPYLFRRAKENTSIAGQTGRELRLILKEKKRRRLN
jgi:proline dehydrogenase